MERRRPATVAGSRKATASAKVGSARPATGRPASSKGADHASPSNVSCTNGDILAGRKGPASAAVEKSSLSGKEEEYLRLNAQLESKTAEIMRRAEEVSSVEDKIALSY